MSGIQSIRDGLSGKTTRVIVVAIIITFIVSENDNSPEGQLGSGMAAAGVCMGGMILSGIFLVVAMIYAMTRKPVNLG